ncbi:MAG: LysM peptidoglycan-binding domain-containing protein [Acidimicrobiales bacterium]
MAAIIEPRRFVAVRPDLRLVPSRSAPPRPIPWGRQAQRRALAGVLALVLALVVVAVGAVAIGRGALAAAAPPARSTAPIVAAAVASGGTTVVTVAPGDSLWSIARRIRPNGDVRALVDRLAAAYGSAPLQPGERLVIPG